jgi:hypothetical protein
LDHPQAVSLYTSHVTEIARNWKNKNKCPHDKKYPAHSKVKRTPS